MAKLRNFQFLRNNTIAGPFDSYGAARTAAETAFGGLELQDGEIALYSYKLQENGDTATVHTLLGIKRNGGIEILGNYDELTYELTAKYQSYVTDQIKNLNSEATDSNNGVSVTVKQVDGVINSVSVDASDLKSAITTAIEDLDVDKFSLTTLNGDKLEGYEISEVDGKIVKGETTETLLTFASAPTTENKVVTQAEINALDATVSNVAALANGTKTNDIRVEVVENDGKLTAVNVTDTLATVAHSGKAENVSVAQIEGMTATNVQGALAELQGDITALQAIDPIVTTVAAGTGISVIPSATTENGNDVTYTVAADFTVDTKKYPTESTTEGYVAEKAGKTYIQIKGIDGEVISETDAAAFVKDGFLQEVELIEASEGQKNVLRFTWNSDAGLQVTDIKVSELCDVYTAKEGDWIQLNGFEFSHKTQSAFTQVEGQNAPQTTFGANADDVTVDSTTEKSFKVPTLTVDAAGHVTAASEKTVTISLPASIDTAIQGGAGVDTTYIQTTVNRNATETNQLDVTATAIIGNYADENQKDGLATTTATKTYVDTKIDALEITTKVTNGVGIKLVDDAVEGSNDHKYTVSLAEVERNDNPNTAGLPSASSFADDTTTFTYVKAVNTDDYGRVTGIVTETVTEFFDAGTY